VRLTGTGTDVLNHPEIGALYLGGSIEETTKATVVPQLHDSEAFE
jgi:hypothetical protein